MQGKQSYIGHSFSNIDRMVQQSFCQPCTPKLIHHTQGHDIDCILFLAKHLLVPTDFKILDVLTQLEDHRPHDDPLELCALLWLKTDFGHVAVG